VALIPITNIRKRTFFTARRAPDADFLAVEEEGDVEVEEDVGVGGEEAEEQRVGGGWVDFGAGPRRRF
jgi:hypothetical protein